MTSKDFVTMNMSYPSAPWHLDGTALASFQPIDLATAKQFIPINFDIVSVLPGKTLGCLYLSAYEPSSTLQYHELIVAPALVSYRGKIGAWISHIYVDNPQSVEGGRNIWGLPKQMADFTWNDRQVTVSKDRNCLCRVDLRWNYRCHCGATSNLVEMFLAVWSGISYHFKVMLAQG